MDKSSEDIIILKLREYAKIHDSILIISIHQTSIIREDDNVLFIQSSGNCLYGIHKELLSQKHDYNNFVNKSKELV